jgi:outer membrane protein assembly factor BamB
MKTPGCLAKRLSAVAAAIAISAALNAGCTANKPQPQPLEPLVSKMSNRVAWNQQVSSVEFPLTVAVTQNQFITAGSDGVVLALDTQTGREVWRGNAGAKLSAGVGSDGRLAAVVTRDAELVVLEQGAIKWRKRLSSGVTTTPLVAGERVFVLGLDRNIQAFDAVDGHKIWGLQPPSDPLTLAQNGVLTAVKDTLVAGQGPRMAGIDPLRGTVRWEAPVGSPRGANEIERLADLVGPAARVGDVVCARSFQAAVGCVNTERGVTTWSKNTGGISAVAADAEFVFAADASDRITAWKTNSGDVAWSYDKLLYRGLSAPLVTDNAVVFGDEKGSLHWLARTTGEPQLRLETDGSPIVAAPVLSGPTMLVVTRKGGIFAIKP